MARKKPVADFNSEEEYDEEDYEEEYFDEEEEEENDDDQEELTQRLEKVEEMRQQIYQKMADVDPFSEQFQLGLRRLTQLQEYEKSIEQTEKEKKARRLAEQQTILAEKQAISEDKQKTSWLAPTLITTGVQCLTNFGIAMLNRSNVKTVVGHEEDGGIVTSKGLKFCK